MPLARRFGVLLTAIPLAVAGLVSAASADTVSDSTAPPYRFVTYNICGNMCGGSGFSAVNRTEDVVDQASSSVWNADDIFLQEVCKPQYVDIDNGLAPLGYTGVYQQTRALDSQICNGSPYGIAMFTKGTVVQTKVLSLKIGGEKTVEDIDSPCMESIIHGRLHWGCSVHLFWDSAYYSELEAQKLSSIVRPWQDAGVPVVLGGDFNAAPGTATLDPFYRPGMAGTPYGSFREADQTDKDYFNTSICDPATQTDCRSGENTFHSMADGSRNKIDYLFFSQGFSNVVGDALPQDTTVSDHSLYRGAASLSSSSMGEITDVGDRNGDHLDDFVAIEHSTGNLYQYTSPDYSGSDRVKVGWSWNTMRDLTDVGDQNKDGYDDLVAVNTADNHLYLYYGPDFSGSSKKDMGSGWATFGDIANIGDHNGDGIPDFVATDFSTGNLYLYESPNYYGSLRTQIGVGWTGMRDITDVGDHNNDGIDDFVAVNDADGHMYMYFSKTYSGGTKVDLGGGWAGFTDLAAVGDQTGDELPDFVATDTSTGSLYLYKSPNYYGSLREVMGTSW